MKLRCEKHNQRVLVLNASNAIHRKEGSKCDSKLKIGSFRGYAMEVIIFNYLESH